MKRLSILLCATAAVFIALVPSASAHPKRFPIRNRVHERLFVRRVPPPYTDRSAYPVDPGYGYEEAPYDPSYTGPGATIFEATKKAQHEPGVTLELAPDAKETATGGPVDGVPGFDGD